MSPKYLVVPFESTEAAIKLEDKAQAQNIPRVSVFITGRGFDQFATLDIKKTIINIAQVFLNNVAGFFL